MICYRKDKKEEITKVHEEILRYDKYVHYLDYVDGFRAINKKQNLNCTLESTVYVI